MATILLAWELGGGSGHCANLAPLAEGLRERGHEVVCAAKDVVVAQTVLGGVTKVLQAPLLAQPPVGPIASPRNYAELIHNRGYGHQRQLAALASAWRSLVELVRPDAIVCEHAPTALLAGQSLDIRCVTVGTGFFSPPLGRLPDFSAEHSRRPRGDGGEVEAQVVERVNEYLQTVGSRPLEQLSDLFARADANLLLTFPELDHYPQRGRGLYAGMWSLPGGAQLAAPDEAPRIFAYLKPSEGPWSVELALAALRAVGGTAVAYVPGVSDQLRQTFSSGPLQVVGERLDMASVAEWCDLAVLNGNAGAATALLLAGKPLLLLPMYVEQHVFGRRVVELGAGVQYDGRDPTELACKLIELLTSDSLRAAALGFAERYTGFDPKTSINTIVDVIEQVAFGHRFDAARWPLWRGAESL